MPADAQQNVETGRNAIKRIFPILLNTLQHFFVDHDRVAASYCDYVLHQPHVLRRVELIGNSAEALVERYNFAEKKGSFFVANRIRILYSPITPKHVPEVRDRRQQHLIFAEAVPRKQRFFHDAYKADGEASSRKALGDLTICLVDLADIRTTAKHDLHPLSQRSLQVVQHNWALMFVVLRSSLQIGIVAETFIVARFHVRIVMLFPFSFNIISMKRGIEMR